MLSEGASCRKKHNAGGGSLGEEHVRGGLGRKGVREALRFCVTVLGHTCELRGKLISSCVPFKAHPRMHSYARKPDKQH